MRSPGVRLASFPPYICHIYIPQFLPAKLSGLRCLAHSPYFGMPDVVRVPQTGGLPSPSFRFHLTMDTLGVRLVVGVGRLRPHSGLSPPRYVPCPAHQKAMQAQKLSVSAWPCLLMMSVNLGCQLCQRIIQFAFIHRIQLVHRICVLAHELGILYRHRQVRFVIAAHEVTV